MIPLTAVIASARVLIEIAILLAGRAILTRNTTVKPLLRVLAGAQTALIGGVDLAIAVIVDAVAALIDLPLARRDFAVIAATGGRVARLPAWARVVVWDRNATIDPRVTDLRRASDAVRGAQVGRSGLAALGRADLGAIANIVVVAGHVDRIVRTSAIGLVALIDRAVHAVIAVD
jgi:hypothetical protein